MSLLTPFFDFSRALAGLDPIPMDYDPVSADEIRHDLRTNSRLRKCDGCGHQRLWEDHGATVEQPYDMWFCADCSHECNGCWQCVGCRKWRADAYSDEQEQDAHCCHDCMADELARWWKGRRKLNLAAADLVVALSCFRDGGDDVLAEVKVKAAKAAIEGVLG